MTYAFNPLSSVGLQKFPFLTTQEKTDNYTLANSDHNTIIRVTSTTLKKITLPNNLRVGFQVCLAQGGTGGLQFLAASGASLNLYPAGFKQLSGINSTCQITVTKNSDGVSAEWQVVTGSLTTPDFDLTSISGLTTWLDSKQFVYSDAAGTTLATTNNQQVKSWKDKYNSKLFSNTTASNIPTYIVDGVSSGVPAIRFNSAYLLSEVLGSLTNTLTLFVITANRSSSNYSIANLLTTANNLASSVFYLQNGYQSVTLSSNGANPFSEIGYPRDRFAVVGVSRGSSGTRFSINKRLSAGATTAVSGGSYQGLSLGTVSGVNSNVDIAGLVFFDRQLSASEHQLVANYLSDYYALSTTTRVYNLVFQGNSITAGFNSGATPYWDVASTTLGISRFDNFNYGVSGFTDADLSFIATTLAPSSYNSSLASNKNIAVCWEGTNSLGNNKTIAQTKIDIQAFCQKWRSAGFKVVTGTILDRNTNFSAGQTIAGFQAAAADVNTWLRANYTTFADALADPASDTLLGSAGAASNATYFADGTHPTQAGHTLIGGYFATAINSISNIGDDSFNNNVAYIVRSTKPTTRSNGSALVVGDRWYDTTNYMDWVWNGTYFLCRQSPIGYGNSNVRTDPLDSRNFVFPSNWGIFLHSISYAVLLGSVNNNIDYYTIAPRSQLTAPPNSGTSPSYTPFSTQGQTPSTYYRATNAINAAYTYTGSLLLWTISPPTLATFGSPNTNGHARFTFEYSLIAP